MIRVFLGAPSAKDISNEPHSYQWQTVSSSQSAAPKGTKPTQTISRLRGSHSILGTHQSQSMILPPATFEAASIRISKLYQNIIFDDEDQEDNGGNEFDNGLSRNEDVTRYGVDQTTVITWPPTQEDTGNATKPSFLDVSKSNIHSTQSISQETLENQSYNYDASSIGRFPSFHFSLHSLTSLSSLSNGKFKGNKKINVLLAALEVEGPDTIRIKKGTDAGKEVSVLKMILGDEEGTICKLTAWREVADTWGGNGDAVAVKRGDIVLLENVTAAIDPTTSPTITASPFMKSTMTICYRAMPYAHEDGRLRPDLRLADSEPCVRKVAAVVRWFEHMAGLSSE